MDTQSSDSPRSIDTTLDCPGAVQRHYMASMTSRSFVSFRISNPPLSVTWEKERHYDTNGGSGGAYLRELHVVLVQLLLHHLLEHAQRELVRLEQGHLLCSGAARVRPWAGYKYIDGPCETCPAALPAPPRSRSLSPSPRTSSSCRSGLCGTCAAGHERAVRSLSENAQLRAELVHACYEQCDTKGPRLRQHGEAEEMTGGWRAPSWRPRCPYSRRTAGRGRTRPASRSRP